MADIVLELELSSGVWTDVSVDVLARVPINFSRGLQSSGPEELIASPGHMSWAFNNSGSNSTNDAGRFSPGHSNCLTNFAHGIRARLKIDAGSGVVRYVFNGRIRTINPMPGVTGKAVCHCVAEDFMASLADEVDINLTLQENQRSDQLIEDVLALLPAGDQPAAKNIATGLETYPISFDDLGAGHPAMLEIMQIICQSERGFLYVRGSEDEAESAEVLTYENRHTRAKKASSVTLTESAFAYDGGMVVPSDLSRVFNDCTTLVFPRRVDTVNAVLIQLDQPLAVGGLETITIYQDYRDVANAEATAVGGKSMVQPAANTDWTFNAAEDGSGSDLTSDLTVTATYYGSRAKIVIENTAATSGYVRGPTGNPGLRARGLGLYSFSPIASQAENSASIAKYGRRVLPNRLEMPYNSDRAIGAGVAEFLASLWADVAQTPTEVKLRTEIPANLSTMLPRDIGDAITVSESLTAVDEVKVFINGIKGVISNGRSVSISYVLAPATTTSALILDDSVAGLLPGALGYA